MSFLSAFFLFGLTAISIPILIHLLNRRASRKVEWGAMRFLRESFVSRRRRILLEEILLLATRCLLIASVTVAMARPFATPDSRVPWFVVLPLLLLGLLGMGTSFALWRQPWWRIVLQIAAAVLFAIAAALVLLEHRFHLRRFGAGSARDVVIVIDGSASMTLKVDGKTNFERAVEEAIQIVRSTDRRTAFGVILAGPRPDVKTAAPLSDRRELEDVLQSLKPGDGSMQTLDALFAAAVVLSQGHNPAKQIVLLTDSQKVGWETEMPAKWELLATAFKRLSGTPQIICRQFKPPQRLRNLAVTRLEFSRRVIGTDRPVTIFVTLENTGSEAVTPGSVTLSLGNTELIERTVDQLAPGKMETIPFSHWFTNAGAYVATAQVTVDDDLSCDNICRKAFAVMREVEVLVVDGHPGGWFSEGAAIFTRLALAPGLKGEKKTKTSEKEAHTPIRPNVIAASQLMREDALRRYAAIVLVDVPYLPPEAASKLARYVAAGGGLIIAPGARISTEFYNHWISSTGQPIMPTEFATQIELPDEKESVYASLSTFSHPALRLVADPQQSDLDSLRVSAYWRLVPREKGSPSTVAGRLTSGDPFLVEGRCGRGTIFVSACAFDGRRSNLVSRRSFLPMLHELVMYLASTGQPDLNLASGTTPLLLLASTAAGSVASARFGISATYYTGVFQSPCAWRVDPMLDFNWQQNAPVPALRGQQFGVRWIGSLVPRYSEKYTLGWVGTGKAEIWIDGNLIIKPGQSVGEVNLEADRHHDLRVEFVKTAPPPQIHLYWSSRSQPSEIIPSSRLSVLRGISSAPVEPVMGRARGPKGDDVAVELEWREEGLIAAIRGCPTPGLYWLTVTEPLRGPVADLLSREGEMPFSVAANPLESRVHLLSEKDWDLIRGFVDLLQADSLDQLRIALEGRPFGQELWRYLAALALLLAVLEVALSRWIAIQRRTGAEPSVEFETRSQPPISFYRELEKIRRQSSIHRL